MAIIASQLSWISKLKLYFILQYIKFNHEIPNVSVQILASHVIGLLEGSIQITSDRFDLR